MPLTHPAPEALTDTDAESFAIYTPAATNDDMATAQPETSDCSRNVPSDGLTVIIRCITSGQVITLVDGHVVLASPGGRGSIHWECVESEGWYGFRDVVSNKFLCHGWDGRINCSAEQHNGWRHFTVTPMAEGGFIMQMLDWWTLRPVVVAPENGLQKIARTGDRLSKGIRWEFVNVTSGARR